MLRLVFGENKAIQEFDMARAFTNHDGCTAVVCGTDCLQCLFDVAGPNRRNSVAIIGHDTVVGMYAVMFVNRCET